MIHAENEPFYAAPLRGVACALTMLLLTGSKPPALVGAIVSHRHPVYRGKLDRNPMV